ncbi:hypothetical protein ZWY2020_058776 [Hordeum vulgare]|nr:hypothetical protein ZWY2020_058776 [Hordeum vulgare]
MRRTFTAPPRCARRVATALELPPGGPRLEPPPIHLRRLARLCTGSRRGNQPTATQLAEPARRGRPAPDILLADLLSLPATRHVRELRITSEDSSYLMLLMHLESSSLDTDFQELCWKATYGIDEMWRNEWNWVKKDPTLT